MKLLVTLLLNPLLGQTPSQAAEAALALLGGELDGVSGALFSKIRKFKQVATNSGAADRADAQRLWHLSERIVATALSG